MNEWPVGLTFTNLPLRINFYARLKMADDFLADFLSDVEDSEEEEVEEEEEDDDDEDDDDFPPDFKEYMKRELNFCGVKNLFPKSKEVSKLVFWNRHDGIFGYSDPSLDLIPDVRASWKVRLIHALREWIRHPGLGHSLVQFWAPAKTPEGQTLLKSRNEPFAFYACYGERDEICKYKMEMLEEYPCFYADAKCSKKQIGLPGRVFLHQFIEFNPKVRQYTEEEYPQLELALRYGIGGSWAMPLFEHFSHSCLGVLEIVFFPKICCPLIDQEFFWKLDDILQEFGLRCFDGYGPLDLNMQYGHAFGDSFVDASGEVELLCESVCKIHNLPFALTWLSCGSCSDVLQRFHYFTGLRDCFWEENCDSERYCSWSNHMDFAEASKLCLLKKGQFNGRILPFPNLLYCLDVRKFSIAEYPLVPYARKCELGGCFTMCLQSSCTGDELYVLEFFFPASNINNENLLATLRLILRTMEEHSKTFKLASGQGFGEALSVEIIDFENGQKSHSVGTIPAVEAIRNNLMWTISEAQTCNMPNLDSSQNVEWTTQLDSSHQSMDPSNKGHNFVSVEQNILVVPGSKGSKRKMQDMQHEKAGVRIDVSLEEIHKCSQMRRADAAKMLKVSVSTLKRVCRDYGILRWPPRNKGHTSQLNSYLPSNEASGGIANSTIRFQDADKVTIRATYGTIKIRFHLSLSSKLLDLQQEVAKRLNLRAETYYIEYKHKEDKEEELTLIACDDDLQYCIQYFRSLGTTSILLHLGDSYPDKHLNWSSLDRHFN